MLYSFFFGIFFFPRQFGRKLEELIQSSIHDRFFIQAGGFRAHCAGKYLNGKRAVGLAVGASADQAEDPCSFNDVIARGLQRPRDGIA